MTIKSKVLAAAATLTLLGGVGVAAATAGTAQASTTGCAFTNGCATLNGHNAAGDGVSMDAKAQNKTGLVIGYPDFGPGSKAFANGDPATSFDAVLHYGRGSRTTAYTDTGLQVTGHVFSCASTSGQPQALAVTSSTVSDSSDALTYDSSAADASGPGSVTAVSGNGTKSLTLTLSGNGTVVIDQATADGCSVDYRISFATGALSTSPPTANSASITPVFSLSGGEVTGDEVGTPATAGTFSDNLPSGITPVISGNTFTVTAAGSTAAPGTYTGIHISYTDADGAEISYVFTLVVDATTGTTIGNGVPYYTFVYAPNGDWTSDCVTDVTGSGALRLAGCTLGRDQYQDFYALPQAGGGASDQLQTDPASSPVLYWIQDVLRHNDTGNNSCLTDPSVSNPLTPQTDAQDQTPPGGRQFYTNGSCTDTANLWSWGT